MRAAAGALRAVRAPAVVLRAEAVREAAFREAAFRVDPFRAAALRETARRAVLPLDLAPEDFFALRAAARGRDVFRARRGAALRRACFFEEFLRRVARAALRLAIASSFPQP